MSAFEPPDAPDELNKPVAGRHRAPAGSGRRFVRGLIAPVVAVVVVVAVILVVIGVNGHSPGNGPGAGVITAPTTTPSLTPSVTPSPTVSTPSATPSSTPTHRVTHHPPAWKTAMAPVRIYNSTRITGIAHELAAQMAARGWTVPDVGNVSGASPVTTLYYSPNARAAAVHLQHEFPGIHRIAPTGTAGIDFVGLTLILTYDWHG